MTRRVQAEARVPALSAALHRADRPLWTCAVGGTGGEPAPARYRSVLGRWWGEGFEYVFCWRDRALRAHRADDPPGRPPAVFAPVPDRSDVLRTVSGREAGELLRLTRGADGTVVRMHWATYRFTRTQETFDGVPASEP